MLLPINTTKMASRLREFEPYHDIPENFMLCMYGVRQCGKTTMLLHMFEEMKSRLTDYEVHLFSGTGKINIEQYRAFPPLAIHDDLTTINTEIGKLLDRQAKVFEDAREKLHGQEDDSGDDSDFEPLIPDATNKNRNAHEVDRATKRISGRNVRFARGRVRQLKRLSGPAAREHVSANRSSKSTPKESKSVGRVKKDSNGRPIEIDRKALPHILVVLDDCVAEHSIRYSPNLVKLATMGRHANFSVIILSQMVCGGTSIPLSIRTQLDTVMICAPFASFNEKELIRSQYMGKGSNIAQSREGIVIMSDVTSEPYRAMIIDVQNNKAIKWEDYLYTYGPVPEMDQQDPDLRMGLDSQWKKEREKRKRNFEDDKNKRKDPAPTGRFTPAPASEIRSMAPAGEKTLPSFM